MRLIECYTDGSCPKQHGDGGWGFAIVLGTNDHVVDSGYTPPPVTNQVMELEAARQLMMKLKELDGLDSETIHVFSDSRYLVDGMGSWRHTWADLGWDEAIKNKELWRQLHELAETFTRIRYRWVKGHAKNYWNNRCDAMAGSARRYGARKHG